MSAPWFRVECCTRWPAHNESYINGLCGHRVHEKHALCVAHTQHTSNEKVGFFTSYLCRAGDLVLGFHFIKNPVLRST